ncbi:hypothetical protein MKW98_030687 [Papaver atlanticum]|uniref:Uncharacterized protein n=1 Tax=Papaver atlanticum TaxID=357466 RepID=A0AAD4X2I8_9MAGN|nr:hypothetical protein MKW98_030687 [Papaver atlanticum]
MKNQGHVWNIICGSVDSSVIKCTVELGILDIIHNSSKPMTLSSLSSASPSLSTLKTENLYRLLRYLSHMNLIAMNATEGNETFSLTGISKLLLKNQERSLKDWVLGIDDEHSINGWHELSDYCLSADDAPTPFVKLYGKTLWELAAEVPEVNELINNAMACDTRMVMPAFVQGCDSILKSVKKLVDIGGGTGAAMSYVVKAYPEIKCMAFDLPHVVAAAPEVPGVEMVGGDMFDIIPSADALLLKFMLHNWKDAECIKLLKRCKETIPEDNGKVIIIEMVLDQDEDDDDLTQARLSLDLDMMLSSGGKERTKDEWRILLEEAGHVWNIICGSVDSSVIKCTVELGILDIIHNSSKPMTLSSLSSASPSLSTLKTENLYRLFVGTHKYVSHMNLIAIDSTDGNKTFASTNLSRLLLKNQERSLKDWVLGIDNEHSINGWHELSDHCLSADDAPTPFEKLHGKTIWEFNAEVPGVSALMNNAMACDTRFVMPAFVQGCDGILNGVKKLLDIGGGTGAAMSYVVKAFPEIKCMVFDLLHVVSAAPEIPGVEMVGGNMFEFIPTADALLLKVRFRHAECIKLLKRCRETIPADHGKVIIMDIVLDQDENDGNLTQAKVSLHLDMMLSSGGKERTKDEWRILLEEAGFKKIELIPIFAIQSVIVAYP